MAAFLKKVLVFSIPVLVLLAVQYLVDPLDLYPPQLLPPVLERSRAVKVEGYLEETDRGFDAVILGSSRAMRLDAEYVGSYGYRCYNFGVNACRAEDLYAVLGMLLEESTVPPRLVIVGIDPELFHPGYPTKPQLLSLPPLASHLEPWMVVRPGEGALNLGNLSDSTRLSFVSLWRNLFGAGGEPADFVLPGNGNYATTPLPRLNAGGLDMEVYSSYYDTFSSFDALSEVRLATFRRFIALCAEHGIRVRGFITCLHPMMAAYLSRSTPYGERLRDLRGFLDGLGYPGFSYRDFSIPAAYGGSDADFKDPSHIGSYNAALIVDRLLGGP